jgi:hypothetical protein
MLRAAADLVVGRRRGVVVRRFTLAPIVQYEHGDLRRLKNPQSRDPNITRFSTSAVKLQQDRHEADYDPLHCVSKADAISSSGSPVAPSRASRTLLRTKKSLPDAPSLQGTEAITRPVISSEREGPEPQSVSAAAVWLASVVSISS